MMRRVLVFTATYDERYNIAAWVHGVQSAVPHADMLIIDDSSPDGTADVVRDLQRGHPQLTLIQRAGKLGLNTAHLMAMEKARVEGFDLLVTMDADGSHQPSQIPRLLQVADTAEFIIGTRSRGGTHQASLPRQVLSKGANATARLLLPMGLSEYTTSFRVFTPSALDAVLSARLRFGGYSFFIECLEVLHRQGVTTAEVPIDFLDRAGGASKIPRNQILLSMETLIRLAIERRRSLSSREDNSRGRSKWARPPQ